MAAGANVCYVLAARAGVFDLAQAGIADDDQSVRREWAFALVGARFLLCSAMFSIIGPELKSLKYRTLLSVLFLYSWMSVLPGHGGGLSGLLFVLVRATGWTDFPRRQHVQNHLVEASDWAKWGRHT
ncbi:MAG: hypothetical protein ACLPKI_20945 [Streptosporangiaceae bacterium]